MENRANVVDLAYLESIADGDESIIEELVEIFLQQLEEYKIKFSDGLAQKDWALIANVAHTAKSSVLSMGIEELGSVHLKNLQLICKQLTLNELLKKQNASDSDKSEIESIERYMSNNSPKQNKWIKEHADIESVVEIINLFDEVSEMAKKELIH